MFSLESLKVSQAGFASPGGATFSDLCFFASLLYPATNYSAMADLLESLETFGGEEPETGFVLALSFLAQWDAAVNVEGAADALFGLYQAAGPVGALSLISSDLPSAEGQGAEFARDVWVVFGALAAPEHVGAAVFSEFVPEFVREICERRAASVSRAAFLKGFCEEIVRLAAEAAGDRVWLASGLRAA